MRENRPKKCFVAVRANPRACRDSMHDLCCRILHVRPQCCALRSTGSARRGRAIGHLYCSLSAQAFQHFPQYSPGRTRRNKDRRVKASTYCQIRCVESNQSTDAARAQAAVHPVETSGHQSLSKSMLKRLGLRTARQKTGLKPQPLMK